MRVPGELLLSDLTALKLEGRGTIFVRPREATDEEVAAMDNSHLAQFTPGYVWVTIPPSVEVMVVGDSVLESLGWMRIEQAQRERDAACTDAFDQGRETESEAASLRIQP